MDTRRGPCIKSYLGTVLKCTHKILETYVCERKNKLIAQQIKSRKTANDEPEPTQSQPVDPENCPVCHFGDNY